MFEIAEVLNPFPGLRPFETDEYNLFFGREGQCDELLDRLRRTRFLAVVGTSGSGKSSLIRAGLLPALCGGLMASTGSNWRIALFRPGNDPIGNLARALGDSQVLGSSEQDEEIQTALIETTLRRSTLGLVDSVRQARMPSYENLLIVVDQFEELFRFNKQASEAHAGDEASAFVKLLLEGSKQTDVNIYVVLTMRSDYLGDCAQFWGLPEAINAGQYLIPRMTRDERLAAITGPAAVGGGEISQALVHRILNDAGDNPDHLPIMQHALMRSWMCWQETKENGQPVDLEHYELVGGMARALAIHATQIYSELPDDRSREIVQLLFQALTEKGEDNREIRRPTQLKDVCAIAEASEEEVVAVIDHFRGEGRSFLMPPIDVKLDAESVIDISHESLIRNWDLLKAWVDEETESARMYQRLATEAVFSPEDFWTGARLQSALDWRALYKPNAAWAKRYNVAFEQAMAFLDASEANRDQMLAAEERQRQAEAERERLELAHAQMLAEERQRFAESEQRRAEEQAAAKQRELEQAQAFAEKQARVAQRLRRFTFALIFISVVALGLAAAAGLAFAQARRSQAKAHTAREVAEGLAQDLRTTNEELQKNYSKLMDAEKGLRYQTELAQKRATEAEENRKKAAAEAKKAREAFRKLNEEVANDHRNRDALAWFMRGNMEIAEESLLKLLPAYRDEPDRQAWVHSYLGATRRKLGKPDESIKNLKTALEIYERGIRQGSSKKGDPENLDAMTWLAHAYTDKSQYEPAQALYKSVLEIRRGAGAHADIAISLENLARNFDNLGQPEEATKLFNEALDIRRKNQWSPDLTVALKEVARFKLEQGEPEAAIALYEEALKSQELLTPDDPNIADTFNDMAQVYEIAGDNEEEKKRAGRLNALARAIRTSRLHRGDSDERVNSLEQLAKKYLEDGRLQRATPLLTRAHDIFARLHGPESQDTVNHMISLGDHYRATGEALSSVAGDTSYNASAAYRYQEALRISRRKSYLKEEVRALDAYGFLLLKQGNFADSERLYKSALEIRERNSQVDSSPEFAIVDNLYGLAKSAVGSGNAAEAEAHLLRALKVFDGISDREIRFLRVAYRFNPYMQRYSTSAMLAEIYRNQGRFKEADEQYRPLAKELKKTAIESLEGYFQSYLDIVDGAGRFYFERGDVVTAELFYRLVWPEEVRPDVDVVVAWPEAYEKSIMARAPISCVDSMIRILNSYAALLKQAGRQTEANEISHGVADLKRRKSMR